MSLAKRRSTQRSCRGSPNGEVVIIAESRDSYRFHQPLLNDEELQEYFDTVCILAVDETLRHNGFNEDLKWPHLDHNDLPDLLQNLRVDFKQARLDYLYLLLKSEEFFATYGFMPTRIDTRIQRTTVLACMW